MTKKILAFSLALAMLVGVVVPGMAGADEVSDLQAQINALLAQLETLQAQLAALGGAPVGVPAACTGMTSFARNLSMGMTGDDVKCLQALLNTDAATQVASSGAGSPGSETTYFGPLTKAAVILFQEKYATAVLAPWGLTSGTGYVGSTTRAKLDEMLVSAPPTEEECADYDNQEDCEAAACYWYDDACNASAQPVPGADLLVELASDTPGAGPVYVDTTVPAGSSNNVATRVKLTAGANGATVSGMTVTKYGTASNGAVDIARVKVYDGANRLGTRVLVTNTASFTFAPVISLGAGAYKVLDLVFDLTGAAASVTRTVALGVAVETDVTATADSEAATVSGAFPLVGSYMNIAQGTFGSLTVAAGAAPPATTPRIGEDDRILANWVISAGANEDLVLESITISEMGTAADGDVTDIKLTGSDIGSASSFVNRRAVIDTDYPMTRGSSLQLRMTGDITAGATRTIWPMLVAPDAVVARGATSGVYFTGPAANTGPVAATAQITGGVMTVTPNVASPTDNLVNAPVPQTIGIFDVRGAGEAVVLQTVTLNITHTGALTIPAPGTYNVALFDEAGGLLSNVVPVANAAGPTAYVFNLSWTVATATTQPLYVKAYTSVIPVGDATKTITVGVGAAGFAGVGATSGAATTAPAAGFNLPAITYRHSGSLQFALNTVVAPLNQSALMSSASNFWTVLTVIATREDMTITSLQIDDMINEGSGAFTSCSLYDMAANMSLTNLDTQAWNWAAGAGASNVLFNNINAGSGITVPMGAANSKNFVVKCSVSGAATNGNAPELDILLAGNVTAVGAVSALAPQAITLPTLTGAETRGKHTIRNAATGVLEIAPNASAPSGDISRSATATVGIWDLTARGTALAFDALGGVGAGALDHNPIIFHCYTGTVFNTSATFRLVDATTGVVYAVNGATVPATTTDVTFEDRDFENGNALAFLQDATRSVKLQENITSTGNYPQYTTLQFGIDGAADINTGADGAAAVNNPGGLTGYPDAGLEAKCPEVRIY